MCKKRINKEVLFATDETVKIKHKDIESLKKQSESNERKRIRLCAHKRLEDDVHEMFIVHAKDTYVRPHKHLEKSESFHVIEGLVDVVIFDEKGNIAEIIPMGDYSSGYSFYYRIEKASYHTIVIKSDFLVFHETTKGPFEKKNTIFAPWSPEEADAIGVKQFVDRIKGQI